MAQDSGAILTIVRDEQDAKAFPNAFTLEELLDHSDSPLPEAHANSLSYVLYTSGSTGVPKAVMNTHRGICNRLLWMQDEFRLNSGDTVIQKTPFSFDVSVWEFFWPLITGARLVMAAPGGHRDPQYIAELINKERVTTAHFVPSMLRVFLDEPAASSCVSLRRVIASGEALTPDAVDRFFEVFDAELHNLYGPTEAAIDVTWHQCARGQARVPIGRPVANTKTFILDQALRPVPVGVPGELFLAGVQLARGYLYRPSLTSERFLPDPISGEAGSRVYRTGDLARWLEDGSIEYLGRIDHQIKIRGFRVELGEIESRIQNHPGVAQAVVAMHQTVHGARIVAYVVCQPDCNPATDELRRFLRSTLPDYMVPDFFRHLDRLPLTPNGKVDRLALPGPDVECDVSRGPTEPGSALEAEILKIWKDLLEVQNIGVHDNFFEIGGNSLLLASVLHRLRKQLGTDLNIRTLFRYPTISSLATHMKEGPVESGSVPSARSAGNRIESQQAARRKARV